MIFVNFRQFLEELEECDDNAAQIAECFVRNNEGFSVYTDYCTNYPRYSNCYVHIWTISNSYFINGIHRERNMKWCFFFKWAICIPFGKALNFFSWQVRFNPSLNFIFVVKSCIENKPIDGFWWYVNSETEYFLFYLHCIC